MPDTPVPTSMLLLTAHDALEVETDVAIVGAGPVGLFAAFECGMLK